MLAEIHTCSSGSADWTIQIDGLSCWFCHREVDFLEITEHTLRFTDQGLSRLDITRRYRGGPVPRDATWTLEKAGFGSGNRLPEQYFFTSREILLQSILDKKGKRNTKRRI